MERNQLVGKLLSTKPLPCDVKNVKKYAVNKILTNSLFNITYSYQLSHLNNIKETVIPLTIKEVDINLKPCLLESKYNYMEEIFSALISGMFGLFSGAGGKWIYDKQKNKRYAHHIFISYPMKAITDKLTRDRLRQIIDSSISSIGNHYPQYRIFASRDDEYKSENYIEDIDDFEALKKSNEYLLIYPSKLASSVLLELGCALSMGKKITILVKDQNDLPYLVKKRAEKVSSIKIQTYLSDDDLKKKLKELLIMKAITIKKTK